MLPCRKWTCYAVQNTRLRRVQCCRKNASHWTNSRGVINLEEPRRYVRLTVGLGLVGQLQRGARIWQLQETQSGACRLTQLYNERLMWLDNAPGTLAAVCAACGRPVDQLTSATMRRSAWRGGWR
jgi:hypothetical protein